MIYVVFLLVGLVIGYLVRNTIYREPKKAFIVKLGSDLEKFKPVPNSVYVTPDDLDSCIRAISL